ncbi:hypothetical protein NKOR_05925 [Candidatus Nitrosopumilus koreensis AR1]|uniref:Uncharacterized protein n=1 Tax=Candidatus Nitrosopumilus koreensis AR1 TaxID=1229908 RepID=K0B4I2_9ARCH|nr:MULTISPECIES: hypothetical protein [Nitrosopumilus]AFS81068.1 hypothetical protein NKOR_05925 [Candidatus Nitrosopumilus koreensis AR1]
MTSRVLLIAVFGVLLGFSPLLSQSAFAAPYITAYVADDPDNLDGVYSNGDTITITLSEASNATAQIVQDSAITGNFTFASDDPLSATGVDFVGEWTSNTQLVINMTDIGSGSTLTIGSSTVAAKSTNNIGIQNNNTDNTVMGSNTTAVSLTGNFGIITSSSSSDSDGNGSGCSGDCEEPTIGIDSSGKRQVTGGFSYNGYTVDVERYFTPYPLITADIGKTNVAEFKIYENTGVHNIRHFTFAFGMAEGEIISQSKAKIELDIDFDGTETVTVTDPENALDNIKVTTSKVSCMEHSTNECLKVSIQHMFRAPLDFNIVGTDVWDTKRSSWQNYYNHGIEVAGESLNPPKEYDGINKGHIYHLTETSKTTAVDEFGDTWTFQYGTWSKDYIKQERVQDEATDVFTRTHSEFGNYKTDKANDAIAQLLELCPACTEEFTDLEDAKSYDYANTNSNKLDRLDIKYKLIWEENKARHILNSMLEPKSLYD